MKRFSIRQYLVLLVLVATVPLVVTAVLDVREDLDLAKEHTHRTLRTLAEAMVANTGGRIEVARTALDRLAQQSLPEQIDPEGCQATLTISVNACAHCIDIFTTDPAGVVRCASRPRHGPERTAAVADAPWFAELRSRNAFSISKPWRDPRIERQVTVISRPLAAPDGRDLGAVHVTFDEDALNPRIPTALLDEGSRYGFLAGDGTLLWRNIDPDHMVGRKYDDPRAMGPLRVPDGDFEEAGMDGVVRLYSVRPVPNLDWVAFIGVPLEGVQSSLSAHAAWNLNRTAVAILVLVVCAVFVARKLTRPVRALEEAALRAGRGERGVLAPTTGPSELAAVANAFNALVTARETSERELRAFLENDAVGGWMMDEGGRYVYVTDRLLRRFGLTREQVIGKTEAEVWPADLAAQLKARDEEVRRGESLATYVEHLRAPDGSVSSWVVHPFRFALPDGEQRSGGLAVDITAQEKAEAARRLADAQLQQSFDVSPIGMSITALDRRILQVNDATCRILGYSREELVGMDVRRLAPTVENTQDDEDIRRLLAGETFSVVREKRFRHKSGRDVWTLRTVTVVRDAAGKPLHFLAQLQDLTERKATEASARLAVVGTLAAGAAHEINNPLTYVMGNLSWVVDELRALRGSLPPNEAQQLDESLEALHEAHGGAERIAHIVAGLKLLSRKSEERLEPTDVTRVMESALQLTATQRNHQARTETRFSPAPLVEANPRQLEQVFINLLVNAAQAIPEGQADQHRITVTIRTDDAGRAVVEVQDSGVGIEEDVMPHLFEPFFTTKPVGAGTGLGLPTCHGIVTALGGQIEVESTLGQGSTFRVLLPGLPATTAPAEPPAVPSAVLLPSGHRVLVLDDEEAVGRSLVRALKGGPEVVCLTDPREALERVRRGERFDLVLCDLMMPVMSGEEFQRQLRLLRPGLADSLVFLTGGAFTSAGSAFLLGTANTWLQKPIETSLLRRLVAERLGALPAPPS